MPGYPTARVGARAARERIDAVRRHPAWAAIRFRDEPTVLVVGGPFRHVETLRDVPLRTGAPPEGAQAGATWDHLVAVPFRQVAERAFEAHDDSTPLVVLEIAEQHVVPLADVLDALPDLAPVVADPGGFETDDAEYAEVVETIIREEIGRGEGANLVIGREYRAALADWDDEAALAVFRRLLAGEQGAYWTFVLDTGDRHLVGASPERHVSVAGGDVRMNPISGTFRLGRDWAATPPAERKRRLLDFLADEKEIYELFMVVDEELKMMCQVCHEGGQVLGPYLKPMTHLVHTEYLLAGRTRADVRDVLRDTMYAATVTGSPVENACRLIRRYEAEGRGYYGAALALFGRAADGSPLLDSPILIRTADVGRDGRLSVRAGTTLVRDSDPVSEVAETHAKAGGILSAFGLVPAASRPAGAPDDLADDEDVRIALGSRNQRLARFWLTDQAGAPPHPALAGRSVVVIDNEDEFVAMLCHVLGVLGLRSTVVRYDDWDPALADDHDLVLVGPGPGDPREAEDAKIAAVRTAVDALLAGDRPFLAVCLGHQVLCDRLGLPLDFKDIVFQGTQSEVELLGRSERVGFYNTFVARAGERPLPDGVSVDTDGPDGSGDVHAVAGPHFRGIQFHAESILTENGVAVLRDLLVDLLDPPVV